MWLLVIYLPVKKEIVIKSDKLRSLGFSDGPYQDSVYLTGSSDWYEGYPGGLTCYSTLSNPAVTLTWYNGSTVFSPETPVSVIKRVGLNALKPSN